MTRNSNGNGNDEAYYDNDVAIKNKDKSTLFAKTLTQLDANNDGSFFVPRYYAKKFFPRLDYAIDPPVV